MIRMMLDGFSVQLTWDDPDSSEMLALQSEIKVTLTSWVLMGDG
jgi:hypothetical protein